MKGPVCRGALIPRLLMQRPWRLAELAARLGVTGRQLRYDIIAVRAAGWVVEENVTNLGRGHGCLKTVFITAEPKT